MSSFLTLEDSIYIANDGNVGIGVTNPSKKFEVVGDIDATTDYNINGTQVLSSTTLGSNVVNSSLTNVGTLSNLTVSGATSLKTCTLERNNDSTEGGQINLKMSDDSNSWSIDCFGSSTQQQDLRLFSSASGNKVKISSDLVVTGSMTQGSTTLKGHIIPDTDNVYDIGSATYKIRDLYVSENSLWVGDSHKVSISGGKLKFRKRRTSTVPAAITAAGGNASGALSHSGKSNLTSMKLKHWKAYMRTLSNQSGATIQDIFRDNADDYADQATMENWLESGTKTYNKTGNVGIGTADPSALLSLHFEPEASAGLKELLRLSWDDGNYDTLKGDGTKISFNTSNVNNFPGNVEGGYLGFMKANASEENTECDFSLGLHNGTSVVERLRILSTGYVGIGDSTPSYKLDVAGDINLTGDLRINGVAQSFGSSTWSLSGVKAYYNSGNVGIGTNSPTQKLDIRSNGNNTLQLVDTSTAAVGSGAGILFGQTYADNGSINRFSAYIGSFQEVVGHAASALVFKTDSNSDGLLPERMRIDPDGNVGIGTTTPSYKLDVNGSVQLLSNKAIVFDSGNFGNDNSTDLYFNKGDVGFNQSEFVMYNQNNNGSSNRYFAMAYSDSGNESGINIRYNNYVGIGKKDPDYKLDVNGDINFTGTLRKNGTEYGNGGGSSFNDLTETLTGDYGTVQTTASNGSGTWQGYSMAGRYVLMSESNSNVGLYNDIDNRWIYLFNRTNSTTGSLNFYVGQLDIQMTISSAAAVRIGDTTGFNTGQSNFQANNSFLAGKGYLDVPWICSGGIENYDEKGASGTGMIFGSDRYTSSQDLITFMTDGVNRLQIDVDGLDIITGDLKINGHIQSSSQQFVFTYKPGNRSTKYTQYIGTHSVYSTLDIYLTDSGYDHGSGSFFRVMRDWGDVPRIQLMNQGILTSVAAYSLHYRSTNDSYYELFFDTTSGQTNNITYTVNVHTNGTTASTNNLSSSNDTSINECDINMCSLENGNVGIGTRSPSQKLSVNGNVEILGQSDLLFRRSDGTESTTISSNNEGFLISESRGGSITKYQMGGDDHIFYNNNVQTMNIKSSGQVDIKLNSTSTPSLLLRNGGNNNVFNNGAQIQLGYNGTTSYSHFIQTRHNSGNSLNAIDFYTCNGTAANTLTSGSIHTMSLVSGNVGIGTTSPSGASGAGMIEISGYYGRNAHNVGHLCGGYNNLGANDAKSNPIYTIGSGFLPAETTLASMYGIGYSHHNASFIPSGCGWGMYVTANGAMGSYLSGETGGKSFVMGNMGVGTNNPSAPLHIKASSNTQPHENGVYIYNETNSANQHAILALRVAGTSSGDPYISFDIAGEAGWSLGLDNSDSNKFKIGSGWNSLTSSTKLTIHTNGNVSIGGTSSTYNAKLWVQGTGPNSLHVYYGYLNKSDSTPTGDGNWNGAVYSIGCSGRSRSLEFNATSDERKKKDFAEISDDTALDLLNQIKVYNFKWKGELNDINEKTGVKAQEVEQIYPSCISLSEEALPSILEEVTYNNYKFNLTDVSDLEVGDKLRIFYQDKEDNNIEKELEVGIVSINGNEVEIDTEIKDDDDQIYIYGKVVDDVRNIDYNSLNMLSIGAIKSLVKKNNILENKVSSLESELAAIKIHLGLE